MKILHIINGLGGGGAEKLIIETIPRLSQKVTKVDVLLLNGEKTFFYKELHKHKQTNIFSLGNSFYNPLYIFKIISYLYKYDIIHVHLFPSLYFVAIAKLLSFRNVKIIFTEHNTTNRRLEKKSLRIIEKIIYSCYQKIVCITPEVKKQLIKKLNIHPDKLITIENGINIENVQEASKLDRKEFGYTEKDIILIMVAAFRQQKDQDTLIKTLIGLPNHYKLILVGEGIRKNILAKLVESLNLGNRVSFLGFRSDVYSLYKMSDIAIISSHWEGFGLVSVEAMASGIPIIASNVEGLNNVVKGAGILFEKGNINELKTAIINLSNSTDFYNAISKNGIEKSKNYSIDKTVEKLMKLYVEISKT